MSDSKKNASNQQAKQPDKIQIALTAALIVAVVAIVALLVVILVRGGGSDAQEAGLHHVEIDVDGYGTIKLELDGNTAPITVENFIKLANAGFYDGLTFHRVISGFMIQGGDPLGNGTGGSDQTIPGEFAANGFDNPLSHTRGAISMARSQKPDSASSQFFIVHEDSEFLDGNYAAFGYVTEGIEVVDAVCEAAKPVDNNGTILPEEQPVITSITIR